MILKGFFNNGNLTLLVCHSFALLKNKNTGNSVTGAPGSWLEEGYLCWIYHVTSTSIMIISMRVSSTWHQAYQYLSYLSMTVVADEFKHTGQPWNSKEAAITHCILMDNEYYFRTTA